MAEIVVLGAGMVGLSCALLLARDGHRVTVLERDPARPTAPLDAVDHWNRPGVNQFGLLHIMLPRWHAEMRRELPDVVDQLIEIGGCRFNLLRELPESWTDGYRRSDDRFDTVTARRPVLEALLAHTAARTRNITIVRGTTVTGVTTGPQQCAGVPQVAGVLTRAGSFRAELVVDASGRRSAMPTFIETIGGRRPVESRDDSGFVYYTRQFRTSANAGRPTPTALLTSHYSGVSTLTLPSDNDTWGVGLIASSNDKTARALRHPDTWQQAIELYPAQAPWAQGAPITGVQVCAGLEDRSRSYVPDGTPVATGVVAVGDAWGFTNPSLGRGATMGLIHVVALRDVLRSNDPARAENLVLAFDLATQEKLVPIFEATVGFTRHRLAEIEADIAGDSYRTDDPRWVMSSAFYAAAHRDPDALRAYLDVVGVLAMPEQALSAPGLMQKVMEHGTEQPRYFLPGPDRAEFLATLAQSGSVLV